MNRESGSLKREAFYSYSRNSLFKQIALERLNEFEIGQRPRPRVAVDSHAFLRWSVCQWDHSLEIGPTPKNHPLHCKQCPNSFCCFDQFVFVFVSNRMDDQECINYLNELVVIPSRFRKS